MTRTLHTADQVCVNTITGTDRESRYHVARFYEDDGLLYRVTVSRDSYAAQSSAVCELFTDALTWTQFMHNPPSNWHANVSLYPERGTARNQESGNDTLIRIADTLFYEARAILSRHRKQDH